MSKLFDFIGAVGKLGILRMSKSSLPKTSGKMTIKGIKKSVEIFRDEWGIPHIYAANLPDLFFAQGVVHAQDRLWQMETTRRLAHGTLAEVLGKDALEIDVAARTLGFARSGKQDLALLPAKLQSLLKSYSKGVNSVIKKQKANAPVEFKLAGFYPEPWKTEDTMAFARFMAWQLSHAWQGGLLRSRLVEKVGALAANELEMHYPPDNPSILNSQLGEISLENMSILRGLDNPMLKQEGGSNSWAISGEYTTTGMPLLANDPHLSLSTPAIWYENHLHCPELHTTGVTIAGTPLVLIGHNAHISWGVTLAFTDCEDLFIEKFKEEEGSHQYLYKNRWEKATVIRESFKIKGAEPHYEDVVITRHGPIISDILSNKKQRIALQSAALEPAPLFQAWWSVNNAKNWKDFVHAMSFMTAPQMNIVYADIEGNIGYWLTGKTPIRDKGDGRLPVPGWNGEYEWSRFIPFMEMPHALNPKKGYFITANNKAISDDYPYHMGYSWMNGYRAKRLSNLFQQKQKFSALDCQQMQLDLHCIPGKKMADIYRETTPEFSSNNKHFRKALFRLSNWEGHLGANSVGGCLFHLCRFFLVKLLFEKKLCKDLSETFVGKGFHPVIDSVNEFQGHDIYTILRILNNPDSWWLREAGGKVKVLEKALKSAVEYGMTHLGTEMKDWQWGELHKIIFPHAMGTKPTLAKIFNVGPYPAGGDGETPWQISVPGGNHSYPNEKITSASFRQIIDMGDLSKSMAVMPPGQSGNIASTHYDSQTELWLNGQLRPMLWTREQVETYCTEKLVLGKKKK